MTDTTQNKPVYSAIPPTSDMAYWQVTTSSDNRTKVFKPIDIELHRALLIELKKNRVIIHELPSRKKYERKLKRFGSF